MKIVALFVAFIATFVATTTVARADIYGYIDAAGVTHLATERLDDQYTLFMRSGGGPQLSGADPVSPNDTPDAALMKTRLFQRLVDHPNIRRYAALIDAAAGRHGLDSHFVKAVIAVESGFEPGAVSTKGAVGLMQVLPATGERYGLRADRRGTVEAKLADPVLNLEIGTRYLADLRKLFTNRRDLVLAAYNAGENAVVRHRYAVPPYPETQAYVKLVDQFRAFYAPSSAASPAASGDRLRVTIPARRNLPDPSMRLRLPAPAGDTERSPGARLPAVRPAIDPVAVPAFAGEAPQPFGR